MGFARVARMETHCCHNFADGSTAKENAREKQVHKPRDSDYPSAASLSVSACTRASTVAEGGIHGHNVLDDKSFCAHDVCCYIFHCGRPTFCIT
ncbi:hypothetical protein BaRGS_00023212, partial [Batillaria attramentaria]